MNAVLPILVDGLHSSQRLKAGLRLEFERVHLSLLCFAFDILFESAQLKLLP
jgi:hypothetical protein